MSLNLHLHFKNNWTSIMIPPNEITSRYKIPPNVRNRLDTSSIIKLVNKILRNLRQIQRGTKYVKSESF